MKKMILTSLFSATLLIGSYGTTGFAEEVVPEDPGTPPVAATTDSDTTVDPTDPTLSVNSPSNSVEPPVTKTSTDQTDSGGDEPGTPITPDTGEKPTDTSDPGEVTVPVDWGNDISHEVITLLTVNNKKHIGNLVGVFMVMEYNEKLGFWQLIGTMTGSK